jgi:hypothetical protein
MVRVKKVARFRAPIVARLTRRTLILRHVARLQELTPRGERTTASLRLAHRPKRLADRP